MSDEEEAEKGDVALAFVATSSARLPPVREIVAAAGGEMAPESRGLLARLFGRKSTAANEKQWQGTNLVFHAGDAMIAVGLMPPYPWPDLEGPCATAWWWPEATERMRAHTHHFLISILGAPAMPPVERRVLLTRVAAAVVRNTDAVGVYWAEGTLVHEPKAFLAQADDASATSIPGPLWIDVRVEQNADRTLRCFTTGLAPLGHLEIEVERATLEPRELLEFVGDTACYIVNNDVPIKDGETMGRTADEKFRVRHAPSMFDRGTVMRLIMD
jgi:hypothetical protein